MQDLGKTFNPKATPQSKPIPGREEDQSVNNAGGYVFEVSDWQRLERFLILGTEGGTYYSSEPELTYENSATLLRCIAKDEQEVLRILHSFSVEGRTPRQNVTLFSLAMLAAHGSNDVGFRNTMVASFRSVVRTGYQLFIFCRYLKSQRGFSRFHRRLISQWYTAADPSWLAYQIAKYQSREGWSHKDVILLSRPKTENPVINKLIRYAIGKWDEKSPLPAVLAGMESIKPEETKPLRVAAVVRESGLTHEMVPSYAKAFPAVWEALADKMPLGALFRNLGNLSHKEVLAPSKIKRIAEVAGRLSDEAAIKKARVHPVQVLSAIKVYGQGRGVRGSLTWAVDAKICGALEDAFDKSFKSIEPTGKRFLVALDVSGSMSAPVAGLPGISCAEGSAAMALSFVYTEENVSVVSFSCGGRREYGWMHRNVANPNDGLEPMPLHRRTSFTQAMEEASRRNFGGTDCALPMRYATKHEIPVDVFVVLTDSETWHGTIHPSQALEEYRNKFNKNAKLVVVAMTANKFSIADPKDPGMLDVVGFDANVPKIIQSFAASE